MSASQPGIPPPSLTVLAGELHGHRFELGKDSASIGRSRECEVQIDLGSVSRKHAVVEQSEGRWFVRDLDSRNGVKLAGQPVDRAELGDGDVITIGNVELRFELPPTPAAAAPVESATEATAIESGAIASAVPGRVLTVSDIVAAAQSEDFAAGRPPEGGSAEATAGLNMRLVALVIIALILSIGVGAFILMRGGRGRRTRELKLPAMNIKAGENRWLSLSRTLGDFSNDDLSIEDPTVVEARKYGDNELLIHALAGGRSTVGVTTAEGRKVSVMVFVRGRLRDPLLELSREHFVNDAERKRRARGYYETGRLAEAKRPYAALMEYRKAEAVLQPAADKGQLYLDTQKAIARAKNTVDNRWNKLASDIRVAFQNNDEALLMQLFDDALALIPDLNDPRHQKAAVHKQRLINQALGRREGRRR